ncbi:hypothetical protein QTV49_004593 [Vibrio vulnificus]|nr:hypothetical protein [Vibrio vulnificus]
MNMEVSSLLRLLSEMLNSYGAILINAECKDNERVIVFDDYGRGKTLLNPEILKDMDASNLSSRLYHDFATPVEDIKKIPDCVNRGLIDLDNSKSCTIEIVPVDNGLHIWIKRYRHLSVVA